MVRLTALLCARKYRATPAAVKDIKFPTGSLKSDLNLAKPSKSKAAGVEKTENKPKEPIVKKKILDSIVLNVQGGTGGSGSAKLVGKGGKGGDVYFIATKGETLAGVKEKLPYVKIHAESGGDATNANLRLGKSGADKWIPVPVGVNIYDNIGNYLGSLKKENSALLIAKGGQGGTVKNKFRFGGGQAVTAKIELQVVADVGILGLQGAGKTTLLQQLTLPLSKLPRPTELTKYAETRRMVYPDFREMSVLDTPGIWSGMQVDFRGQKILSYLRRTRLLMICLDATGSKSPKRKLNLFESYMCLNKEIEEYNAKMLERPTVVVVNKYNQDGSQFELFQEQLGSLTDFVGTVHPSLRPEKFFQPKHVVGMDLRIKEEDKLNELWRQIRELMDLYEYDRLDKEEDGERFIRMQRNND
ncbi:Hypothetical predicted protein [Cloeon dipterum]|uniref:Obg domain-containing protein n=1 Tax=Cloeon dipterum TaxID=197152 RepID=A0A8S1DRR7_9INSE|nr:Hypothetical predicted protein [Cloeon dipterum]